jgi:hypothetical protein
MNIILVLLSRLLTFFDIDFEIREGTKRLTFVFHQYGFALKFAKFQLGAFCKLLWMIMRNKKLSYLMTKGSARNMLFPGNIEGIIENLREYVFYIRHKDQPFLFPVFFSFFGLVNIMPIKHDVPGYITRLGLDCIFEENTKKNEDRHHFKNPDNFCFYRGYLCMVDYGSIQTQEIILIYDRNLRNLTIDTVIRIISAR